MDERDIARARQYSRQYPTNFATRIERYQDYLRGHQTGGGRYVSEATEAKDRVLREWDAYAYRLAYDHLAAHPDDVAEAARRFREYLHDHRDGRYARDARAYLDWWEKVSVPGEYRVTLRRGAVEPGVGKYLGGGPDLGVVVETGGASYGPSPVVPNTRQPIWDYTFPRPVRWKLGDPVTIKIYDYDWNDSLVYVFTTRKGDPLAIRNLSGTIRASKGGRTSLTFASDFKMPALPKPEGWP